MVTMVVVVIDELADVLLDLTWQVVALSKTWCLIKPLRRKLVADEFETEDNARS